MTRVVEPVGTETSLSSDGFFPDSVTLSSGNYVVSRLLIASHTEVQVYDRNGTPIDAPYVISNALAYHSLSALSSGGFVLVYSTLDDVRAQIFSSGGIPIGADFALGASDYYSNSSIYVSELAGGGFVASWRNEPQTIVKTFDDAGAPVATLATTVPSDGRGQRVVELNTGTIAVVWHEYDSVSPYAGGYPDGYEVVTQLFTSGGAAISPKVIVNQSQAGSHGDPEIAALAGGGFIVTWVTNGADAGIKAQIFDAAGAAVGPNLQVSDLMPGFQSQPDVAALSWGGFLISWSDSSSGNPQDFDSGIRAQLFDAAGTRVGTTVQVNDQRFAYEVTSSITVLSDNEARIFYHADGNANPSGIVERTIALPSVGTLDNDILSGSTGADHLAGLTGDDRINGGDGDDALDGGFGNDLLNGGHGNDTLVGGFGNDTYVVDSISDVVTEAAGEGTDTISTALASYTLASANVENLTGTNAAGQELTGDGSENFITGATGDDTLNGGAGRDTLVGGLGNDRLYGNAGADMFLFDNSAGTGRDKILDFGSDDILVTTQRIFDSNNDGIVTFGSNHMLDLFGSSLVDITKETGGRMTALEYDGMVTRDDVSYYVYSAVGSTAGMSDFDLSAPSG